MSIQTKTMKVKSDTSIAETSTTIRDTVTFDVSKMPNGITYKGLKAVLSFAEPIQWNKASTYDALTVVWDDASHGSYASKRPVPQNIELTNEFYWLRTADLDAQVEMYRQEVRELDGRVTANAQAIAVNTQAIADEVTRAKNAEQEITSTINKWQTPEYYGASGDGITDDTEAFNKLLESNGVIYLTPNKTYLVDNVAITANRPISFYGNNSTIKTKTDFAFTITTTFDGHSKNTTRIFNTRFDCNGKGGIKSSNASQLYIDSCYFENFTTYGFYNDKSSKGFEFYIDSCIFSNRTTQGTAIHLKTSDSAIYNCVIVNAETGIYSFGDNYIANCHLWGGLDVESTSTGVIVGYCDRLEGNYFDKIKYPILIDANTPNDIAITINNSFILSDNKTKCVFIHNPNNLYTTVHISGINMLNCNGSVFTEGNNIKPYITNVANTPEGFFDSVYKIKQIESVGTVTSIDKSFAYGVSLRFVLQTNSTVAPNTKLVDISEFIFTQGIVLIANDVNTYIGFVYTGGVFSAQNIAPGKYTVVVLCS